MRARCILPIATGDVCVYFIRALKKNISSAAIVPEKTMLIIYSRCVHFQIFLVVASFFVVDSATGRKHHHHSCREGEIACRSGACINRFLACDGLYHCEDGSDETSDLCQSQQCPAYMFRCAYGACTRISSPCNGVYDCVDLSDEPPYHSCRRDQSMLPFDSTPSTTKQYTPYPFSVMTTTPLNNNHRPHTVATSTTKRYTPFTFAPSSHHPVHTVPTTSEIPTRSTTHRASPTPHTTSKSTPTSPTPGTTKPHSTTGKTTKRPTTNYTPPSSTQPTTTSTQPTTTARGSTSSSCKLPPIIPDRTYMIDGCYAGSRDPICQTEPGESVDEGVALNYQCNVLSQNFTSYCLKGEWIPPVDSCEAADCGNLTVNIRANSHIPWQVSVYDKSSESYTCGGVIVAPYAIISAAHCFYDSNSNKQKVASDFQVTVGRKSRRKDVKRSQTYDVTEIHFSSDGFHGSSTHYVGDIAVLEVSPMIAFSPEVGTVCLDLVADQYSKNEMAGLISPYNDNGGNGYTETTRVTFTPYDQCVELIDDMSKPLVTFDKICLLGRTIEQGNAGNGLYTVKSGASQYSQYRLRGLLSTMFEDSKSNGQVYTLTDIGKHLFWLPKTLNDIKKSHENETLIDIRGPFSL